MSEVITVGASTRNDSVAYYSPNSNPNRNIYIELVAPSHRAYTSQISTEGFEIWSTDISGLAGYNPGTQDTMAGDVAGNYSGSFGGTSAACPQVAGAAALILALNPNLTADQVANVLTSTADKVGGYNYNAIQNRPGASLELGYGRLNVYRALQQVGTLTFQFINRIKNTTNYGTLVIDNDRQNPVPSGSYRSFPINSNHVVRTNELPFVPNWNGTGKTVKHHRFYATESDFSLNHSFQARPDIPSLQDANFLETEPATITTDLIDAPGTSGGIIQLRDPWRYYKDANNDWFQSNQFISYTVPFEIQNNSINSYGGVFLNQGYNPFNQTWTPPYYSVKADAVQDIYLSHTGKMHKFYFQNWSASPQGSADFQNPNALETPVVFKQEGAVVSANYKGSLLSNNVNAFGGKSQRKIIKRGNELHLVYESMGNIWYEYSADNGRNWILKNNCKPINISSQAKNPSISFVKDINPKIIGIVYQANDHGGSVIRLALYNLDIDQKINDIVIKNFDPSKSFNIDANPVIEKAAVWDEVLIIWYEPQPLNPFENPEGLYCLLFKINQNNQFEILDDQFLNSPFTVAGEKNINPAITSINDIPIPKFYIAYEKVYDEYNSSIIVREVKLDDNGKLLFVDEQNISKSTGYERNKAPNIIAIKYQGKEIVHIGWLGQRKFYPIDGDEMYPEESKAIFCELSLPNRFFAFGDDVQSVSLNRCNTRWTFAWSRGNDLPVQYVDSRDIRTIYQLGNLRGVDVYVTNGIVPEDMFAFAINTSIAPYPINYRAIYGEMIPEELVVTEDSREGVVSKEGADVYYSIGDIKVGDQKVEFYEVPDTVGMITLENANRYLISKPFMVNDNSGFVYTIKYGVTDSSALKEALTNTDYIKFRVELIDYNTKELLGVFDEVTYNSENVSKYENINYYVNTEGLGERMVQLRLVITNNIDPYYSLSDKFSDASYNMQKKRAIKQISYKGMLGEKIYSYELIQNYPNPFNPVTKIRYTLKETNPVMIKLYDIVGREVATLVNEVKDAGEYEVELDAGRLGLSSGVYFYQMKAGEFTSIKKMVVLK